MRTSLGPCRPSPMTALALDASQLQQLQRVCAGTAWGGPGFPWGSPAGHGLFSGSNGAKALGIGMRIWSPGVAL